MKRQTAEIINLFEKDEKAWKTVEEISHGDGDGGDGPTIEEVVEALLKVSEAQNTVAKGMNVMNDRFEDLKDRVEKIEESPSKSNKGLAFLLGIAVTLISFWMLQ